MFRSYFRRNVFAGAFCAALAVALMVAVPAQAQTFNVIWDAPGGTGPGANLIGLVLGRDGNYYGSSVYGGANGRGEVYQLTPAGDYTDVYDFTTSDPQCAYTPQILGTNGNLYGAGTGCGDGTIFELTTSGTFTVLYTFNGTNGSNPSLAFQGSNGDLYGVTTSGGANTGGTFFLLTTSGTLKTLYSFANVSGDIWLPEDVILGKDGNYYGVTFNSNVDGTAGALFKLTPSGTLSVVHYFTETPDGANPTALMQGSDGNLYGVTQFGGANGDNEGTIYKMTTSGTETILHSVNSSSDGGSNPTAVLIEGSDGNFYSTMPNCTELGCSNGGNVFEITPAGTYTTLAVLGKSDGTQPYWGVIQDPNGTFYGVTDGGGTGACSCGVVFSVSNNLSAFAKLESTSGREGAKTGIFGRGFGSSSVVKFGGVQATTIARSGSTFINAIVPAGALTGAVTVTTGATTLTSWQTFDVSPTFPSFNPTSGVVGTQVTLTGTGLTQTTRVTFNGKSAAFTVNSDTQVTATVPTGATTGKIKVTTDGGSAASTTSFTVN